MSDEIRNSIHVLNGLYTTGLNRIAEWNKYVPNMQQTAQYLDWMEDSISHAPNGMNVTTDERLLDYLGKATQEARVFLTLPEPSPDMSQFISASGTAVSSQYYQYVNESAYRLNGDPEVAAWAGITISTGDKLIFNHNRSETVRQRLDKLNPDLGRYMGQASKQLLQLGPAHKAQ